jgi:hypothetical protein
MIAIWMECQKAGLALHALLFQVIIHVACHCVIASNNCQGICLHCGSLFKGLDFKVLCQSKLNSLKEYSTWKRETTNRISFTKHEET